MRPRSRKLDPVRTYYLIAFGDAFFFTMALIVMVIFQTREAGLNPFELLLVGSGWQGAILLTEMPTGVIADTYGRRRSVIMGFLLLGAGAVLSGWWPDFWPILGGSIVIGVGRTFLSGAKQAWIADEVGVQRANAIYLRTAQLEMVSWVAAVPVSFAIAAQDLNLPIILGGFLLIVLGLALFVIMPEQGFVKPQRTAVASALHDVRDTYSEGLRLVRLRPLLLTMFCITAFYGMAGQGFQHLWVAQFDENIGFPSRWDLDPIVWFGVLRFVASLLGVLALEIVQRRGLDRMSSHASVSRALFWLNALQMQAILLLAAASAFELGALGYCLIFSLSFIYDPFYLAWINQNVDSRVRATVISMNSQADAFGSTLGGPFIGAIGSLASLRTALSVSGLALIPALLFYLRAFGQGTPAEGRSEPAD